MHAKSLAAAVALALAASVAAQDGPPRPRIYFPRQIRREFSNSTVATPDSQGEPVTTSIAASATTATAAEANPLEPAPDALKTTPAAEPSKGPSAPVDISVSVTPSSGARQGNDASPSRPGQPSARPSSAETELDKPKKQEHSTGTGKENPDAPIVIAPTGIVKPSKDLDTNIDLRLGTGVSSTSTTTTTTMTTPTSSLSPIVGFDSTSTQPSTPSTEPTGSDKGAVQPPPVINGTDTQEQPATTTSKTDTLGPIQSLVSSLVPDTVTTPKAVPTSPVQPGVDTTTKQVPTSPVRQPDTVTTPKEVPTSTVQPGVDTTSSKGLTNPVLPTPDTSTGPLTLTSLPLTTAVPADSSVLPIGSDKSSSESPLVNNTSSDVAVRPTDILSSLQPLISTPLPGDLTNSTAVPPQISAPTTTVKETPAQPSASTTAVIELPPVLPQTSVPATTSTKETPLLSLSVGPVPPEESGSVTSTKGEPTTTTDNVQPTAPLSSPAVSQTKPALVETPVSNSSSVELPSVPIGPTSTTLGDVPAVNTTSSEKTASTPFTTSPSTSSPPDIPVTNSTSAVDEATKKPATTLSPIASSSVVPSVTGSPTTKTSLPSSSSLVSEETSKATGSFSSPTTPQDSTTRVPSTTASSPTESTVSSGTAGPDTSSTASTANLGPASSTSPENQLPSTPVTDQLPSTPVTEATIPASPPTQPTATPSQDPFPTDIPKVIAVPGSDVTPEGSERALIALDKDLTWGAVVDNATLFGEMTRMIPAILATALNITDTKSIRSSLVACNIDNRSNGREWRVVINTTVPSSAANLLVTLRPVVQKAQKQLEGGNNEAATKLTAQFDLFAVTNKCGGGSGKGGVVGDVGGAIPPSTGPGGPTRDVFTDNDTSQQSGAQRVRTGVVTAATVAGSAAFAAAMFVVARRYKRKKQPHRRSDSITISQGSSEMRYTGGGSPALMGGALLAREHFNYGAGGRDSRGSGRSGMGNSGRTANISAPVAAENSLGWN